MAWRHVGLAATGAAIALTSAVLPAQTPRPPQMVEQTVAGVKFNVPAGFAIERINPPDKTDSYVVVTFDSQGRLVVSKEQDHPRLLLDNNGDGIYESEKVISDRVRNCQGLWFDGRTLYGACSEVVAAPPPPGGGAGGAAGAAGGGGGQGGRGQAAPAGMYKMTDTNGDDVADTFETVAKANGGIAEHGPHAIRRGPDGQITWMIGNHSTVADESLDLTSPVLKDRDAQLLPYLPNFGNSTRQGVHSGVYRWDPKVNKFTVLFGGNRNAYDHAFNLHGEAFLFDSDMEWDINMPWYREVRTVHGIPGGNYGYRDGSGKYPDYFLDSLPPVRDVGRGSPVGVEFYTSYTYPKEYFESFFEADWSRGRLLYTALTPNGATYTARSDRAEFVHGEPLNITDLEVGPDGLVYFTTGGRNTTGGLWRVRYTGKAVAQPDMSGILAVVRQPQPLSSWGWAAIEKVKGSMGPGFGTELERFARNASASGIERARAMYELQRHGPAPSAALLKSLATDTSVDVRAAVMFVAGVQGGLAQAASEQATLAAAGLKDANPMVRRRAAEALVRMGQSPDKPSLAPVADIWALLNDNDRFVRWAGRLLLEKTTRSEWQDRVLKETNPLGALEGMIAFVNTASGESLQPLIDKQLGMMKQATLSTENKLRLFRAFQYTASQMEGGVSPAQRAQLHALLIDQFPSRDERMSRELARLLAYAGQPQAIAKILAAVPKGDENQQLQLHYLYALRVIKEGWTAAQKVQLAELLGRTSHWRGGAQFLNFVGQMFDAVSGLYTTDAEQQVLFEKAPDFAPLTPAELQEIQARQAAAGGRGGGRGGNATPLAARRQGRVLSRQEMLEETVYQPQQQLDVAAGRKVFEANCASCHKYGSVGTDHGVAGLNLSNSTLRASKFALLEAVFFPDRKLAVEHETTVIETTDGRKIEALVLRENGQSVALLARDGTTTDVPKAHIKSRTRKKASIMPDTLADTIPRDQMRHLAAFLTEPPPVGTAGSR